MHTIDWAIVAVPLLIVIYIGLRAQRHVQGVSDFLAAGRVAGRYVVAVSSGEAAMGLISLVALFEAYYNSGFAYNFWNTLSTPIMLVLTLSGFCIYRFRETRALTMGQFLEIRYSKSFRIFAALLQAVSGVINYALFPAVGARFLIYFCDLPMTVGLGGWEMPTFALLMMIFLSLAVAIIWLGGQITVMVTDCVQGILSYPMYLVIVAFIIWRFSWHSEMMPALLDRPAGKSMLNPFDISDLRDFNLFYVVVGIISNILNRMSWAGNQGYNAAAATPHEQKMGGVLSTWRSGFSNLMYILLAVAAFAYMSHANFAPQASQVRTELAWKAFNDVAPDHGYDALRQDLDRFRQTGQASQALRDKWQQAQAARASTAGGASAPQEIEQAELASVAQSVLEPDKAQVFTTIFGQMRVPMALRSILPMGIAGVFCAIAIFLMTSTDTSYMHSWGSIIVQDFILPFRKKPFTPRTQLALLRGVIAGVAVFAFFFSYLFGQVDYILMFFAITGAIWLGGAGAVIVGGLYWKRGTGAGAWAAMISSSLLATLGLVGQKTWVVTLYPWLSRTGLLEPVRKVVEGISDPFRPHIDWRVTAGKFPINSQEMYLVAILLSLGLYIGISLLTSRRRVFNMDRMLHRGRYRVEGQDLARHSFSVRGIIRMLVGITSEYTRGDRILAWSVFYYSMIWGFGVWVVIIIWNAISRWPDEWWGTWFFVSNVVVAGVIGAVSTVWFTIGGTWDLWRMFKRLKEHRSSVLDDGRVVAHVSADDLPYVAKLEHEGQQEPESEQPAAKD